MNYDHIRNGKRPRSVTDAEVNEKIVLYGPCNTIAFVSDHFVTWKRVEKKTFNPILGTNNLELV